MHTETSANFRAQQVRVHNLRYFLFRNSCDVIVLISELNRVTSPLSPSTPTFFHAVSKGAGMADGTGSFLQRRGTATELGVIIEVKGRVLRWDAI